MSILLVLLLNLTDKNTNEMMDYAIEWTHIQKKLKYKF